MTIELKIKRLHKDATLPTKAHPGDAGWDLYADDVVGIDAWGSLLVPTGISVAIPYGWCGLVRDRSSVALKHFCVVKAGVIDHGFTGEIKVLLHNPSPKTQWFNKGDRIAQMLILPEVKLVEVDSFEETARGDGSFGSTGT